MSDKDKTIPVEFEVYGKVSPQKLSVASSTPQQSLIDRGWINLHEFAELMEVSYPTILSWKDKGWFKATWHYNCWRIEKEEVERYQTERNRRSVVRPDKSLDILAMSKEGKLPGLKVEILKDRPLRPSTIVAHVSETDHALFTRYKPKPKPAPTSTTETEIQPNPKEPKDD
jgi:hypothetical protein